MDLKKNIKYKAAAISLLLHLGLVLLLFKSIVLDFTSKEKPLEIEIIEKDKTQNYVKFLESENLNLSTRKKKVKFLSKENQFVKKESLAKRSGLTRNAKKKGIVLKIQSARSKKFIKKIKGGKYQKMSLANRSSFSLLSPSYSTSSIYIKNIGRADVTALNTKKSDMTYYAFFLRQRSQYYPRWSSYLRKIGDSLPKEKLLFLSKKSQVTAVQLILDKLGNYMGHFVIQASQSRIFDNAVVLALKNSSPYPNPPKGLVEDDGFIYLHLAFTVMF